MNKLMSLALLLALVLGCRTISTLTGSDTNLKKVADLWSDVPRMDGIVSSEADMPMFIKILMRTALNNLYRLNSNNEAEHEEFPCVRAGREHLQQAPGYL